MIFDLLVKVKPNSTCHLPIESLFPRKFGGLHFDNEFNSFMVGFTREIDSLKRFNSN